ncbi:uncharacterized protein LOC124406491 [Diprion similis]|uniref:uncharacterized protein LOC124406491 n=1 Tax=Diprion similis TaxID=362088 RepID=UPI001EF8BBA2|nr:uncharacterized protein LOC124406491 [Diprion similis]
MFGHLWKKQWLSRPTEILWFQWIGGLGSMLMLNVIGMLIGMFSPFLALMTTPNSSLFLTLDEASWVASLSSPARLVGAIFGSITVNYLGSKRAMLIGGCPLLLAWVCLILADSAIWLYGTSFAHGLGIGIAFVSFPVYLGEVSSSATRGTLVSFALSGFPLGSLIGNILGTYLPKETFGYVALVPTIVYIAIFLCVPESPHYYVKMGKYDEAKRSISRYHPKVIVKEELESLQTFVSGSNSVTVGDRLRELITPRNRKAGVIILILYLFMHFSGLNSILYYMEMILKSSNVTAIAPATVVIVANVLDCVGGWVAMSLADRYGRRPMWIISACGACVTMVLMGANFTLLDNGYNFYEQQWVPIVCMISFRVFLFVGVFSLPSIFMSELIAPNVKGVMVCLGNIFAGLIGFVSTKSYQPSLDAFGEAFVFYMYAVIMFLAVIFGFKLPETKGKTLQEIQKICRNVMLTSFQSLDELYKKIHKSICFSAFTLNEIKASQRIEFYLHNLQYSNITKTSIEIREQRNTLVIRSLAKFFNLQIFTGRNQSPDFAVNKIHKHRGKPTTIQDRFPSYRKTPMSIDKFASNSRKCTMIISRRNRRFAVSCHMALDHCLATSWFRLLTDGVMHKNYECSNVGHCDGHCMDRYRSQNLCGAEGAQSCRNDQSNRKTVNVGDTGNILHGTDVNVKSIRTGYRSSEVGSIFYSSRIIGSENRRGIVTKDTSYSMFGHLWKKQWLSRPTEILWFQWIGGLGSMLMLIVIGMLFGMFSPFLALMTTPNSSLFLTLDEASWVASLSSPARLVGGIFGSITVHYLGGKRAMLIGGCPLLLAWVCLILADSAIWLYGTSFSHGLGIGIAFVSFPVYLGEVSSSATRGTLVSFAMSGFPLGSLVGNILGTYLPKTTFGYIALVPTIVYIIIFICVPESPHYYVKMGKLDEAKRSISRYHPKVVVNEELQSLQTFTSESNLLTVGDRLRELMTPRNRKVGVIILLLHFFMHFSGLNSILYYMEMILKRSNVTAIAPATVVIVANVLDCVGGWVAMSLADRYGRKPMWIISACGASASMVSTGVNFTLLANGYNSYEQQWVPVVCMISFRVFLFVGITSIPSIFLSELIAPNLKSLTACLGNILAGFVGFASTKSYQPLLDAFGEAFVFYMYAVIMFLAVIFGFTLPETKGKTLQAIQNM